MQGADSTRFLFEVESNDAALPDFSAVVQLSWITVDGSRRGPAAATPPALWASQRWTLVARLKRPHGNANFRGRDAEVALLARNIRATGYVSMPGAAFTHRRARLRPDHRSLAGTPAREGCERVLTALDGAAHQGIVSAQKAAAAGAAVFAAFYAALAGFNVPAQRSMWMLCFVTLACAERPPASVSAGGCSRGRWHWCCSPIHGR